MNTEAVSKYLLYCILQEYNPKNGVCIEIGVGNFDFYFLLFCKLGYRTIAVEPLPSERLISECKSRGVHLETKCIANKEEHIKIYHGSIDNIALSDVSSIHADWWGASNNFTTVPAIKYDTLLKKNNVNSLICLKVDVEGAEWEIIQQITENNSPKVMLFEFGGGGYHKDREGGWIDKFVDSTVACIRHLKALNYKSLIQIEQHHQVRIFDLTDITPNAGDGELFLDDMIFGNFIVSKEKLSTPDVESFLEDFQDVEGLSFYRDNLVDKLAHRFNRLF